MTKQRNPERAGNILANACLSEGGCLSVALSPRLPSNAATLGCVWLLPGKWRQEVVTFLIEQIKTAGSRERMADVPSVPPGPFEATAMLRGAGTGAGQGI